MKTTSPTSHLIQLRSPMGPVPEFFDLDATTKTWPCKGPSHDRNRACSEQLYLTANGNYVLRTIHSDSYTAYSRMRERQAHEWLFRNGHLKEPPPHMSEV